MAPRPREVAGHGRDRVSCNVAPAEHRARPDALRSRPPSRSSGRRLRRLHCIPMHDASGRVIGGIALLRGVDEPLDQAEWALFDSIVRQGAQAYERSRRSAYDHGLALRLQRSLLPEALPDVPGMQLAGHYRAGSEGLEVGGDWYDAVRRRDGIVPPLRRGRRRPRRRRGDADGAPPRRLPRARVRVVVTRGDHPKVRQHVMDEDVMITLACVALDPYSGADLLGRRSSTAAPRRRRGNRDAARGRGVAAARRRRRRIGPRGTAHARRTGHDRALHRRARRAARPEHRSRYRRSRRGRRGGSA